MEPHVVVMFQPACPSERLTPSEQVNEVFGLFPGWETADRWVQGMEVNFANRQWLIIPLSSPEVLKQFNYRSN